MSLNHTPSANRIHIGFFGRRNVGKSSLVNAVTGQELAVVSDTLGTTTDPVPKAMELLPLGPVVIIDTPGFDDEGRLGEMRVKKTRQVLNKTDIAVLVLDASQGKTAWDEELIGLFEEKGIPYLLTWNKADLIEVQTGEKSQKLQAETGDNKEAGKNPAFMQTGEVYVSALTGDGIFELKERIGSLVKTEDLTKKLVSDLVKSGDFVVLVIPIDKSAPKGRLILPQQQVIRDLLEAGASSIVVKENHLKGTLDSLGKKPALVITDSQVFASVAQIVPEEIPLTSFSILMARFKGYLETALKGAQALESIKDGDQILISEGCTHHRQCEDIGTVKIPNWLIEYTGKTFSVETTSGVEFPEDLSPYRLVIHCGGCMLNEREVRYRMKCAVDAGVPFVNYGIAIAHMKGILKRSVQMIPDAQGILS